MGNTALFIVAWLAVVVHATAGLFVARRFTTWTLLPVVNAVFAVLILAYWIPKWISYATEGITWYATDQAVPLYALVVLGLSAATLTGHTTSPIPHWLVYGIDMLALLAAALVISFFRIDNLI